MIQFSLGEDSTVYVNFRSTHISLHFLLLRVAEIYVKNT